MNAHSISCVTQADCYSKMEIEKYKNIIKLKQKKRVLTLKIMFDFV